MQYIFDTNSFAVLRNYYPDRFPTFWDLFNESVEDGDVISVREVYKEMIKGESSEFLLKWIKEYKEIFLDPTEEDLEIMSNLLKDRKCQEMIKRKNILRGTPAADPFIISAAIARGCVVVTEEKHAPNSSKIPTICNTYDVECVNASEFMKNNGWSF